MDENAFAQLKELGAKKQDELAALRARVTELEALKERLAMLKTERDTYRDDLHAANDELDANDKRLLDLTRLCDGETALPDGTHYNAAQLIGEIREFVNEVSSERDSLLAENAKLKVALQPFALAAEDTSTQQAGAEYVLHVRHITEPKFLPIYINGKAREWRFLDASHLRAAAAALKAGKP